MSIKKYIVYVGTGIVFLWVLSLFNLTEIGLLAVVLLCVWAGWSVLFFASWIVHIWEGGK